MTRRLAFAMLLPALLAGCSLTPTHERPAMDLPQSWDSAPAQGQAVDTGWWRRFGSGELNTLMDQALAANLDLEAARRRVEQARASVRSVSAGRLPSLDASGSASHSRRDGDGSESDQALLSAAYEVDLWGGREARIDAAEARFQARRFDRDALALVVQSEVAAAYFQSLALTDRLEIARRNLAAAKELLRLVQVRFDAGAASALELAQQRSAVASIEGQIPALEQQRRAQLHALAVLLGRAPQGFALEGGSLAALELPAVAPEQPASLLERRPDLMSAEAALIAANADIGAARAALYPSLRLSASAGASGLITGGSATLASLGANLVGVLFDGGQRRAEVEISQSRREELAANYRLTVLRALEETANALVAVETSAARAQSSATAAESAEEALRLANLRFQEGAVDLLTVLDAQRTQLSAQDTRLQAELARLTASLNLFKALGGGWESAEAP